ncbi:MAG: hypothetical protein LBJ59_07450 [Zoogloeaceae bacterium]|nr:hypothetical protein [Zoogloeaceae bacterium]
MTRTFFLRCGAFLFGLAAAALVQAAEVGKVAQLVPGATLLRSGQTQPLRQNASVLDSDVIATDATGRVRIVFNDDTALSFGGNTRINLRDFVGVKKTAFSARLLQSAARSASKTISAQNPGGFGGIDPTATAGGAGLGGGNAPILVNVKGTIDAGLDYAFEFRMNLAKGIIFQGVLADNGSNSGKAYRLAFTKGEGEIGASGWRVIFTDGSVQAKDANGATTHKNWKVTLSGSDTLHALKAKSSSGGSVQVTGFNLQDAKGALVLEYSLTGRSAQATSSGAGGPPKFY